jgi:serine/threonine-protein kinase RsbW
MKDVLGVRAAASEFSRLIAFAEEFAGRCRLAEAEKSRLLIILEELFTNTVDYGYPGGGGHGRIEVALAAKPGRLEIDFCDDAIPFDPLAQELREIDPIAGLRRIGGEGLRIVRSLVHEVRYSRQGGRNRLALVRRLTGCGGRQQPG